MAIDTLKLRSPYLQEVAAAYYESQSVLRSGMDLRTGEMLYEMTSGQLQGSYDSRISFKVMRDEWKNIKGRCELLPSRPYLLVECSAPKILHGHNVYGAPCNFPQTARLVLSTLELLINPTMNPDYEFPGYSGWEVRRVDWAEMFDIHPDGIAEYFRALSKARFPRRTAKKSQHGEHSLHFPGEMTTLRLYHKGPEFVEHDLKRIARILPIVAENRFPNWTENQRIEWVYKKINMEKRPDGQYKGSFVRLAYRRLRCEVQINAPKLTYDFRESNLIKSTDEKIRAASNIEFVPSDVNAPALSYQFEKMQHDLKKHDCFVNAMEYQMGERYPLIDEVTDEYLISVYETEMQKLLHEGKSEMETVRTHEAVRARLLDQYSKSRAKNLLAFWMRLSAEGEALVRIDYDKSSFYKNRSELEKVGISWHKSDVCILPDQQTMLPRNFQPYRGSDRICSLPIRSKSPFCVHPADMFEMIESRRMRLAANADNQKVAA